MQCGVFKVILTNIDTKTHSYQQSPAQLWSVCPPLTVHVHQDADVGVSHGVENLTGHGLGEEGVIRRGDKHTFSGSFQQNATFRPSDGETKSQLSDCSSATNHYYVCLSRGFKPGFCVRFPLLDMMVYIINYSY